MFFDFEAVDFNGKLISNIYQHRQKRIRVKKYPNKMKRGRKINIYEDVSNSNKKTYIHTYLPT